MRTAVLMLHDRQVVQAIFGHRQQGIRRQRALLDRFQLATHDVVHGNIGRDTGRQATAAQVPVGDQPDQTVVLHDQQGGDPLIRHHLRRGANATARRNGHGVAAEQFTDLCRQGAERVRRTRLEDIDRVFQTLLQRIA